MMKAFTEYWQAVSDHYKTCKAVLTQLAMPALIGCLALFNPQDPASSGLIVPLVSIITGLLFSMLIMLIDLRGKVRKGEDLRARPGDRDTYNLDFAYYATNYAILAGVALCSLLLVESVINKHLSSHARVICNWVLYSLTAHFGAVVLHCLLRLRRCYEVFGKGNS